MKKFFVCLLALLMSATCIAEVDLSSMTTDELFVLDDQIWAEISEREGANDRISTGVYIVGKAIRPGTYDFLIVEAEEDNTVAIYNVDEDGKLNGNNRTWGAWDSPVGTHITINLSEGQALYIECCSGLIKEVKPSWAP